LKAGVFRLAERKTHNSNKVERCAIRVIKIKPMEEELLLLSKKTALFRRLCLTAFLAGLDLIQKYWF